MRIGVFDSGIGGVTVLNEIINKYPNCEYIYYGDNLHLPYGEKTKEELIILVSKIMDFLISKKVDLIVIACGTVSSTIYEYLCLKHNIKIINVIDSTINKIKEDKVDNIAVLATKRTIDSKVFSNKLDNINVLELACAKFVPLLEKGIGNKDEILDEYLKPIKDKHITNIVLGCTHYPLLKEDIRTYLGYNINFYDMGVIISNNLKLIDSHFKLKMYFSELNDNLVNSINKIIDVEYQIEERVL